MNLKQIIEDNGFIDVAGDSIKSHEDLANMTLENSSRYLRNYKSSDIIFYVDVKDNIPNYLTTYIKRESWATKNG